MKLIDAIRQVKRPDAEHPLHFSAPIEDCCHSLGIAELWSYPDDLDTRFKSYPIMEWNCTDTYVGLYALYLDGEPVGATMQTARKNGREIEWLSAQHAARVREVLLSYADIPKYAILNPDQDIGDDFSVGFVGEALTDDGFYQGRPVRVLVWYDHIYKRSTPMERRCEGKSYTIGVEKNDPRKNCVLVQDGADQRLIPIEELRLAFNVEAPAE